MAITSAGAPVSDATQATKQRWNCLGIEGGENIAEMIVRRRAIAKRPEPAQKLELLSPNRAMSTKASAPASTASRHSSSTSSSG